MNTTDVMVVRIYMTESSHLLNQVLDYLKTETKVRGVSVFRAISGFGESGAHTSSFVTLSLDLPLTIELIDQQDVIEPILEHLSQFIKSEHMVFWKAKTNT